MSKYHFSFSISFTSESRALSAFFIALRAQVGSNSTGAPLPTIRPLHFRGSCNRQIRHLVGWPRRHDIELSELAISRHVLQCLFHSQAVHAAAVMQAVDAQDHLNPAPRSRGLCRRIGRPNNLHRYNLRHAAPYLFQVLALKCLLIRQIQIEFGIFHSRDLCSLCAIALRGSALSYANFPSGDDHGH